MALLMRAFQRRRGPARACSADRRRGDGDGPRGAAVTLHAFFNGQVGVGLDGLLKSLGIAPSSPMADMAARVVMRSSAH